MNICIIGGSGFVGTRLMELLVNRYNLINLDKRQSQFFPNITQIVDIRDSSDLKFKLSGQDMIVLLAAEHRDDVQPVSDYYDVNVQGTRNVLEAMTKNHVKKIIFTSSVAVYGLNKHNPDEQHPEDPFNHYGKSKWQAEEILREWYNNDLENRCLTIIRPTVIFGERNRGNVYNLLKQIASGKFLMIGSGNNKKSMAYVGNVVAFIESCVENLTSGYHLFNYIDKPDFSMNELVDHINKVLRIKIPSVHIPYLFGLLGGYSFDLISLILQKKFSISSVRIKKFCAVTQFNSSKIYNSGFRAPYTLSQGLERTLTYEFVKLDSEKDDIVFVSE